MNQSLLGKGRQNRFIYAVIFVFVYCEEFFLHRGTLILQSLKRCTAFELHCLKRFAF